MLVVGLTGGIGSGKSTVADLFAGLGVPVIDTDIIARELVAPGQPALQQIVEQFGDDILLESGELDRGQLAEITFHDSRQRHTLESILHPPIRQEMQRQLEAQQAPYALVIIPLLAETGQTDQVDRVLVVDCPEQQQITRVQARDQRPPQQIRAIIDSQVSRQQRLDIADDVILNNGDLHELEQQVLQLHHKYQSADSR